MMTKEGLLEQVHRAVGPDLWELVQTAGEIAAAHGQGLYLVGGVVRDLLLGRPNLDLDLVVEGDAVLLAYDLAQRLGGEVLSHKRFGTARFAKGGLSLDFATARTETYLHPGALPSVKPSTLYEDLGRRDFTINAMALALSAPLGGQLVDPFRGKSDLEQGLVRVLHDKSFEDDPTRMFRAVRYEQRLGFRLEAHTEDLLRAQIRNVNTISGDRIRGELELAVGESAPEHFFHRASALGLLAQLSLSLGFDDGQAQGFRRARELCGSDVARDLYMPLLFLHLPSGEAGELFRRLKLTREAAHCIEDARVLWSRREALGHLGKRSALVEFLKGFGKESIQACIAAAGNGREAETLGLYLNELRFVRPMLNGEAIKQMGVTPGPLIGKVLQGILKARLDGEVHTLEEEVTLARKLAQAL